MRLAILSALTAITAAVAAPEPPPDFRYKVETLIEGMPQPMQLQFAPDGRIFFIEIAGKVKVFHPDTKQVVEAGALEVFTEQENGLLGMALDPDFAHNHWLYLLHSPKTFTGQHLSRFTMNGDAMDMASEKILLTYEEQRKQCCHHAGALRFGPDGSLYFSAGDNTNPFESDGLSPLDMRPDRSPWDAQKSSANMNDLRGGIGRIKPMPDGTYTIPPGNLFSPGTPGTRPELYVKGCRNPWRFNIDQVTGILYYGDVGNDAGGDSTERGPRGFDHINQVRKPGFFGWPYFRADSRPYAQYDFATKAVGVKFDPAHPVNESPNNTGAKNLPPAQPAWIFYGADTTPEFPMLGKGGRTACAGPVFHWKPEYEKTGGLPRFYDNCLVIYDWSRPFIKWVRLDKDANRTGIEDFTKALPFKRLVDMVIGPDGALWLLEYGDTWGENKDSALRRVSFQSGNLAPVAVASAKNTTGREPLTVELSAEGSKDYDGDPIKFEWRLQPGDKLIASTARAKVTIAELGNFRAELRVTDDKGATGTAFVPVMVGNTAPVVKFESPENGDFFTPGEPVKFKVSTHDAEDGDSAAKPDECSVRTLVSASWSGTDAKAVEIEPGLALMKQSDCFNCHAVEQQIVGPPLLKIAEKYRDQAGAENASVQRVLAGSTGVWGQVGMLPHPQHNEDEIHLMVHWIFSLKPGAASPGMTRGLTGEIIAPKDGNISSCVLEATYTDAGRAPASSLSGRATVTLRSRRLEAEAGEIKGAKILGSVVGAIDDQHHVKFAGVNLADVGGITARASSGNVGGKIEFRAGSPAGDLLGSVEVPNTGGWEKWIEPKTALAPNAPRTRADVYAVFVNPGKGGLMNLDWVRFDAK